jgi:branched-chain amino acid transport system substrate-binding protein
MKLHKVSALAAVSILAFAACSSSTGSAAPTSGASAGASTAAGASAAASVAAPTKGELKVGVTLPLSGGAAADGQPTLKGAQLAVDQANAAGGVGGYSIKLVPLDHAVNGKYNEQQGAQDMQNFVADDAVVGVVGPYNSAVAKVQIPISNDAGLLQCSPANTNFSLTIPEFGALDYRKNFPDRINYVRVAANDTIQGPAMAVYDFNTLNLRNLLIVDDVTTFGKGVADTFQKKFEELGGKVVLRQGAPADTTDFNGIISSQALTASPPDGVYYGGVVTSGAGLFLKQLRQAGLTIPFTGPDGINNGTGKDKGSLIQIAGVDASKNSFSTVAAIGDFPGKADFDAAYKAAFGKDADFNSPGTYSGPAHACATVILKSLEETLKATPDADKKAIREGVRAYASDTSHKFETVLGTESFDKNGDTTQPYISFYATDPAGAGGAGEWVFKEQQAFGPS